jgi:hypothetical protein
MRAIAFHGQAALPFVLFYRTPGKGHRPDWLFLGIACTEAYLSVARLSLLNQSCKE